MISYYIENWGIYVPLTLAFIALIIGAAINYRYFARRSILSEIERNILRLKMIGEVLNINKKEMNNDIKKTFEHSRGFLTKSVKDLEYKVYSEKIHLFKNGDEKITLENIYKSFSVISDILSFIDKINTVEEIDIFMENFRISGNIALYMANKILKIGIKK